MDDSKAAHCRLCAELKCYKKLVNLEVDDHKRLNILEKLCRLGVYVANIESIDDILPKTVCFVCIELLDKCVNFVSVVEDAQIELNEYVSTQKVRVHRSIGPNERLVVTLSIDNKCNDTEVVKGIKTQPQTENDVEARTKTQKEVTMNYSPGILPLSEPKLTREHQIELVSERDVLEETESLEERNVDCNLEILPLSQPDLSYRVQTKPVFEKDMLEVIETQDEKNMDIPELQLSQICLFREGESEHASEEVHACVQKVKIENGKDHIRAADALQPNLSWKDYSWRCAFCDTMFPNVEELKTHSKAVHKTCSAFRCTECNKKRLKLDDFIMHVKYHRKYLNQSCYRCYNKLSGQYDSIKHKFSHFHTKYRCLDCNDTFNTQEELNRHIVAYNKGQNTPAGAKVPKVPTDGLTCLVCLKTFKVKGSLRSHLFTHTERTRDHTCEKCGKCFLSRQSLNFHTMQHEDARPYQCDICKSHFRTKAHLSIHVNTHDNSKPFRCKQCGRRFRLEMHLNSHIEVHADDSRPHKCTHCDKAFRLKSTLINHLRQHTGEKPFKCLICDRDFTNVANLNKHLKRYHTVHTTIAVTSQKIKNENNMKVRN